MLYKKKPKKLLMIAYYFPPLGGSGALRPFKLAKYLPDFGWNPIVLTVKNPDWYYAYDPSLLQELPPEVEVVKDFMLRSAWIYRILNPLRIQKFDTVLRRHFIQPDDQMGWIPFGYLRAIKLLNIHSVKIIYSTSAPLSCHLIAYLIKKKTGIPWIADFRDEWFENPEFNFPTIFHRKLHYKLENLIVNSCDKVITAAPIFGQLLAKHTIDRKKILTITMGFDLDDFPKRENKRKKRFVLAFSGLFYGSFRPNNFLKAVEELIAEKKISPEKIKVMFIGANTESDTNFTDTHGICEFKGFVTHKKSLQYLSEADALLLLLSKERGENVIPSKTFEYMASKKPILAIVPSEGKVAKIIRKSNTGIIADFDNIKEIKTAYYQLYCQWKNKKVEFYPIRKEVCKFDQRRLTKKFASLIDELIY